MAWCRWQTSIVGVLPHGSSALPRLLRLRQSIALKRINFGFWMISKCYRPDFVKNPKRRRTPHSKKEKYKAATHAALQKGKIQSGDEHRTPKMKNQKRQRQPQSKKKQDKARTSAARQT